MAHNPSDAMVRLFHVAISGVLMLVSLAVSAMGLMWVAASGATGGEGPSRSLGYVVLGVGCLGFLASAARTFWLVFDWRRHREERSSRP